MTAKELLDGYANGERNFSEASLREADLSEADLEFSVCPSGAAPWGFRDFDGL